MGEVHWLQRHGAEVIDAHAELVERIRAGGASERTAAAFAAVPREVFIPATVWRESRQMVQRDSDPTSWCRLVYSDEPVVTQRDDAGIASSSSSAPSIMARMLEAADIQPGHRVLEIGTGTGFNAALLCELAGRQVTTVEVDDGLAERARVALAAAGYSPRVVADNGLAGYPPGAPYDRVLATCTVPRIPAAWIDQTCEGGLIVTPWAPVVGGPGGVLARLEVREGQATGRFSGSLAFMWVRGQRSPGPPHDLGERAGIVESVEDDPRDLLLEGNTALVLGLMVPGWRFGMRVGADGEPFVWVSGTDGPSWARLHADRVEQGGPRRLWGELEQAHRWWVARGQPPVTEFGLSAGPEHRVWLGSPDGSCWRHG